MPARDVLIRRSAAPLTAEVDGELVMLDPQSNAYFGLDAIGHRIWRLLEHPTTIEAMVSALVAEYDIDSLTCDHDVSSLVDEMIEAGLVEFAHRGDD